MGSVHRQRGQTSIEYLGLIVAVAAILAVLVAAAPGIGGTIVERISCVIEFADCPGDGATPPPTLSRQELLDKYRSADLDDFLAYRNSPNRDPRLDFSTDGCSAPVVGSTGISFDFTDACTRHDFGYRNSKALDLFDEDKAAIDSQFLEDMKDHCATRSIFLQASCYRWAYTFYAGVREFG